MKLYLSMHTPSHGELMILLHGNIALIYLNDVEIADLLADSPSQLIQFIPVAQ